MNRCTLFLSLLALPLAISHSLPQLLSNCAGIKLLAFEADEHCFFSTAINDEITCSKDGEFDFNGFESHICRHYPCNKIIEMNKKFGIDIQHQNKEILLNGK